MFVNNTKIFPATVLRPIQKRVALQSEIGHLAGFQLQLELVRDQGDEFGIGRFSLCAVDSIAEESLQGIQVASVPGHFDGVTDGPLHSAGCSVKGLGHLRIKNLGDGVDHIHIVYGNDDGLPQILISLDMGRDADGFVAMFMAFMLSCLLSCFYYTKNGKPVQVPMVAALISRSSLS